MFSKEEIALVPKVIEAIKKIAERQEKKCLHCREGLDPICRICNSTGKVKGKWEWEPGWNELALSNNEIVSIRQHWLTTDKRKVCRVAGRDEKSLTVRKEKLIPLPHWERIEKMLKGMGHELSVWKSHRENYYSAFFYKKGKIHPEVQSGKTRQLAVMRAVIELGKEK